MLIAFSGKMTSGKSTTARNIAKLLFAHSPQVGAVTNATNTASVDGATSAATGVVVEDTVPTQAVTVISFADALREEVGAITRLSTAHFAEWLALNISHLQGNSSFDEETIAQSLNSIAPNLAPLTKVPDKQLVAQLTATHRQHAQANREYVQELEKIESTKNTAELDTLSDNDTALDDAAVAHLAETKAKRKASYRTLMQLWGTDIRRAEDPDYWVAKTRAVIVELDNKGVHVIIDDVRFIDEAQAVNKIKTRTGIDSTAGLADRQKYPSLLIRLHIPTAIQAARLAARGVEATPEQLEHPSETELDNYDGFNTVILNADPEWAQQAILDHIAKTKHKYSG